MTGEEARAGDLRAAVSGLRTVGEGIRAGTDEVASVKGNDYRMFSRRDRFRDENVGGDGVAVDYLIGEVVDVERCKLLLDGCDHGGIHVGNDVRDLIMTVDDRSVGPQAC